MYSVSEVQAVQRLVSTAVLIETRSSVSTVRQKDVKYEDDEWKLKLKAIQSRHSASVEGRLHMFKKLSKGQFMISASAMVCVTQTVVTIKLHLKFMHASTQEQAETMNYPKLASDWSNNQWSDVTDAQHRCIYLFNF